MQLKTGYEMVEPYITKDGAIIREFMHSAVHGNPKQSLAEAIVPYRIIFRFSVFLRMSYPCKYWLDSKFFNASLKSYP
ncbi:Mannose-6-phosphate isomerase [Methanosarcina siciliae T4/M]|uniref:Mannose-6-phosphate isomerase n=2 Tax=Methanosarcina siciliae TaxID=38027 RepID=A0A0E3P6W3_9EURY|nr:Mannose-6-phosphate isomerase [Methanosarcina siciliae T4/M]